MWVIFHKAKQAIVGFTADADIDLDKETALKEVTAGLLTAEQPNEYDAIQVTDRAKAAQYIKAFPHKLVLTARPEGLRLSIQDPEFFRLNVATDAPDVHPVDGVPEIPADGTSSALITLKKINSRGKPMQSKNDNDLIYLRTDHGVLRDKDGKKDIGSVLLVKGAAQFRLYSEPLKRLATVRLFNADDKLSDAILRIEFI